MNRASNTQPLETPAKDRGNGLYFLLKTIVRRRSAPKELPAKTSLIRESIVLLVFCFLSVAIFFLLYTHLVPRH